MALGARRFPRAPTTVGRRTLFRAAPVDPQLAAGVERLCERVGYYGVFETEFIQVGGRSPSIHMNPRFYGQLAFEVARGLPLPQLAYAAALGDDDEVARLVAQVPPPGAGTDLAYCNRFGLGVQLGAQRLFGSAARGDAAHWSSWLDAHEGRLVHAVADPTDAKPYAIAIAGRYHSYLRHPGVFIRHIALDR